MSSRREESRAAVQRPERKPRPENRDEPKTETRTERAPRKVTDKAAQPVRKHREDREPPSAPGEWNGPVPGFLDVSAT